MGDETMTEAEIRSVLAAIEFVRETIHAVLPLDDTGLADTAIELAFSLGSLRNLEYLLERDLRSKRAEAPQETL